MTTLITFRTYGTWLHGDERGSVDRENNDVGEPFLETDPSLVSFQRSTMSAGPTMLDVQRRVCVDRTMREVADHRKWTFLALNVLQNHVHIVISAPDDVTPEKAMNDFKSWSTRRLRENALTEPDERVWAQHGSTRYLNSPVSVHAACDYVNRSQHDAPLELNEPGA